MLVNLRADLYAGPMPPPKRTQAQRRANTERRVLDAAIDLIARHGSHAVSLAQVGEAAGYSRGIVTHTFGSREKLLDAVLRDAQTFHVPDNAKDGLEWLEGAVCAYLENIAKRAPVTKAFLQMWGEAIAGDPVLKPRFAKLDAQFREFLAQRVRDGMGDELNSIGCRSDGCRRLSCSSAARDRDATDRHAVATQRQGDHRRS